MNKFKRIVLFILIISLTSCFSEEDKIKLITKDCILNFYNGNLDKLKINLDEVSLNFMDSIGFTDTLGLKNNYQVSVIKPYKINDSTYIVKTAVIVNSNIYDTINCLISNKTDSYKFLLREELLHKLLFHEEEISIKIAKIFYNNKNDKLAYKWFHYDGYMENAESVYYIGKINSLNNNYNDAIFFLNKALEKGYDLAVEELSLIYTILGERERAITMLKEAAKNNNIIAMNELGNYYDNYYSGLGYNPPEHTNPESSFYWYNKAANKNDIYGMIKLGEIYENGKNRPVNLDSAFYWYNKASEFNDCFSKVNVGRCYIYGIGIETNFDKGWMILENATKDCPIDAYYEMGKIYQDGIGVNRNLEKSLEYYKKALIHGSLSAKWRIKEIEKELNNGNKIDFKSYG